MTRCVLVIGNKNYSSWSLRAWLALKQTGVAFEEILVPLMRPETRAAILAHSPSGKVPLLRLGDDQVWDSLAIAEYLAERFPAAGLCRPMRPPAPSPARWRRDARRLHAPAPRPADEPARQPSRPAAGRGVEADIARIQDIWQPAEPASAARAFLFGGFSIADAFYAPWSGASAL